METIFPFIWSKWLKCPTKWDKLFRRSLLPMELLPSNWPWLFDYSMCIYVYTSTIWPVSSFHTFCKWQSYRLFYVSFVFHYKVARSVCFSSIYLYVLLMSLKKSLLHTCKLLVIFGYKYMSRQSGYFMYEGAFWLLLLYIIIGTDFIRISMQIIRIVCTWMAVVHIFPWKLRTTN